MNNLRFDTDPLHRLLNFLQIYAILIGQVVIQVEIILSNLALLFISKYQINPILNS